jgi:poly-gamma-glutamate synthesis protein (capsule biosynthesis protein)
MMRKVLFLILAALVQCSIAAEPIRIVFVGDIMLDESPGGYIKGGRDPFASVAPLFRAADITIGNLECVVGTSGKREDKPFTFRAHPRVVPVLRKHFSALSLANNHSGDYGMQAFVDMLALFDRAGLKYFGAGREIRSAHEPAIFDVKGRRVAVLGYNEIFPRSFEALNDRPGVAWSDDDYVRHGIERARKHYKADHVIAYPHWGVEHDRTASPRQVALARLMIDHGADAVVGGHPHVTQNIEIYKGKPVFYSLGNFVFNGFEGPEPNTGWVLTLTLFADAPPAFEIHTVKINRQGIPRLVKPRR